MAVLKHRRLLALTGKLKQPVQALVHALCKRCPLGRPRHEPVDPQHLPFLSVTFRCISLPFDTVSDHPPLSVALRCSPSPFGAFCATASWDYCRIRTRCSECGTAHSSGPRCLKCTEMVSRCAVCRVPVGGAYLECPGCHHGGHFDHMMVREGRAERKREITRQTSRYLVDKYISTHREMYRRG